MGEPSWAGTETAVRVAVEAGNLNQLVPLLAPTVTWHGCGPGGCRNRADVTSWLANLPGGFRLLWLRRVADRIALAVADPTGNEAYELMVLDDDGYVTGVLDYPDADSIEADLVVPVGSSEPSATTDGLVPFVPVGDIETTIAFYSHLGFEVVADHRPEQQRVWASLRCGPAGGRRAELMVALAEQPIDPAAQDVLFYLYTDDLDALRQRLRHAGYLPSAIADGSPGPRRELRIDDPDGYCLMIAERE